MASYFITHRPSKFSDVIGHQTAIRMLKKQLSSQFPPHSYMFTGMAGIGKTTLARILATELGATPTGIVEINTADLRGIDGVRQIIEQSASRSPGSKRSVYILDEVHGLTNDAQNALLKVLEEPPQHVYFVLATTDPNKVIPTVRSRCIEVVLSPLSDDNVFTLLLAVMEKEKLDISEEILQGVCDTCGGSGRMALNLLERVAPLSPNLEAAEEVFRSAPTLTTDKASDSPRAKRIAKLLLSNKWIEIAKYLRDTVYSDRGNVIELRQQIAGQFEWKLFGEHSIAVANAIILLESQPYSKSDAVNTALLAKVHALLHSSAAASSAKTSRIR